jgi:hypothetical protein
VKIGLKHPVVLFLFPFKAQGIASAADKGVTVASDYKRKKEKHG